MSWKYGLVEINKELVVCEIYYISKFTSFGLCPVGNKDLTKNARKLLVNDIGNQLVEGLKLTWKNNKLHIKTNKKKKK